MDYFRDRGAFRRFRDLLEIRGLVKEWHKFQDAATDEALRDWCEVNGIRLIEE